MLYKRINEGLNDKGVLVPETDDVYQYIKSPNKSYFVSTYNYNEEQKKQFDTTGTISGITEVTTNKLWFDFDSEFEIEEARKSTLTLVQRLLGSGIDRKNIQITYSGNKGFGVEVNIEQTLLPKEAKEVAFKLSKDIPHFDVKMYNASRILRLIATKHEKTGLYKTPLTYNQLKELNTDQIITLAKEYPEHNEEFQWNKVNLPPSIYLKRESTQMITKEEKKESLADIDFSHKIKGWSNCKWALAEGHNIKAGDRHEKLLCIVATAKSLNYTQEDAYYKAKGADEKGVLRNGGVKADKESIWKLVESVYSSVWLGGTYSCKDGKTPWLTELCQSLGHNKCSHDDTKVSFVEVDNVFDEFKDFAVNIEKNTIKTGIPSLDNAARFRTGQMIGMLGAPSSGKTSLALEVLENTSRQGLLSVFYSLDMSSSELFQKIAQRVTNLTEDALFKILKEDPIKSEEIKQKVFASYSNVKFCFDTGISVEHIQTSLDEFEMKTNQKVKLLMLDYNELLSSPHSDSTASSGYNAGALKKLTNKNQVCTISLLQPPKAVGDASDEITSYRSIKGSSLLEQCFSIVIGVFRPGFSAKNDSRDDRFMVMNVLKNRLGKLSNLKFGWHGPTGKISPLDGFGEEELWNLINKKSEENSKKSFI